MPEQYALDSPLASAGRSLRPGAAQLPAARTAATRTAAAHMATPPGTAAKDAARVAAAAPVAPGTAASPAAGRVVCILGLPFHAVTLQDAVQSVRAAVRARRRLFLSTPNLNFLIGSRSDDAFRASVLHSDLSVADGMPLVWMSRLLGTPLPERVTGSDLFERLRNDPLPAGQAPIKVFFFGGPPGAAEAAAQRLNAGSSAMTCVGFETPGFGSVDELSGEDTIDRINARGADFLVVALGAAKGQAWIERNLERLQVPVISHLGAVVNFEAGTVSRAPGWVQRSGLEWLWRIKEEPALWRRYGRDARALLGLLAFKLLPHALWLRRHRPRGTDAPFEVAVSDGRQAIRLRLGGTIPEALPDAIGAALCACTLGVGPVLLDLGQLDYFSPSFAGRLLQLEKMLALRNRPLRLVGASVQARRLLRWNGLESLLERDDRVAARAG
jgi:N-acetylglucosaminyldiphosphoundecaprenol N-acetyl-beta-D-mannosaminyltransferase